MRSPAHPPALSSLPSTLLRSISCHYALHSSDLSPFSLYLSRPSLAKFFSLILFLPRDQCGTARTADVGAGAGFDCMQRCRFGGDNAAGKKEDEMSGPSCSSAAPSQVVKVKRKLLVACMTCPLCRKLLKHATTISECLHTFCRKCIYEKLADEELDSCPICSTDLGCAPLEKLRPDNNIQDVRSKIFPFKRRKVEAPELVPSITLPIRRKERSLSSLVVNAPRIPSQSALTRRRTKAAGRKGAALRGLDIGEPIKKEEDSEDFPSTSSFPETLGNISQNIRQKSDKKEEDTEDFPSASSFLETLGCISKNIRQSNSNARTLAHSSNDEEPSADDPELWKPLNGLVEAANFTVEGSVVKSEQVNLAEVEENVPQRSKSREHFGKPKISNSQDPVVNKPRRRSGGGRKRAAASKELESEKEPCPIWLSLVSAPIREGDAQLPQLSSSYLRIKDSSLPVLLIQKYLAKKLDLASESEVEISCRGQEVTPSLAIHKLVDLWLQTGSSKKTWALTGSPAENFVMVLTYARKVNIATV